MMSALCMEWRNSRVRGGSDDVSTGLQYSVRYVVRSRGLDGLRFFSSLATPLVSMVSSSKVG